MAKKETTKDAREKRIAEICANINKGDFGGDNENAVTWLGSRDAVTLERFPSGCPDLDEALGGGWPKGKFVEIFGPESGGKSTLTLHAIAEHQKAYPDEDVALIDSEYSFDEEYAVKLGVQTKYVIVNQPTSGEQALNILKQLIQAGVSLIVVDSVAALTTRAELEGDIGDAHMAEQARLMSPALRQLNAEAAQRGATVFWTNQIREKIGVMYGDKTTTPAGKALKHYAAIRASVVRIGVVKEKIGGEDVVVSAKTKVDVKKNKTAAPFRTAEFFLSFGRGIDTVAAVVDASLARKVIKKDGNTFTFEGEKLGVGRQAMLESLRSNDEWLKKISDALDAAKQAGVPVEETMDIKRPAAAGGVRRIPVVKDEEDENEAPEEEATTEVKDV